MAVITEAAIEKKFTLKHEYKDETEQTVETLRYMKPGFIIEIDTADGAPFAFGKIKDVASKVMGVELEELANPGSLSDNDIIVRVSYSTGYTLYASHCSQIRGMNIIIDRMVPIVWNDRRLDKRFDCKYCAAVNKPIFDEGGHKQIINFTPVIVKDISLSGAYVIAAGPLIGTGVLDIFDPIGRVTIPFTVARHGRTRNGYGIHFADLDDFTKNQIHKMIFKAQLC